MIHRPKILLLIDPGRESGRKLILGILKYARIYSQWEFYQEPPFYKKYNSIKNALAHMKKLKPDGIITQEPQKYKQLIDAGIPTIIAVHLKEHYPDVPYQFVENEAIGTMAAEHLLERGFKNFAYCGVFEMASSLERCESFAKKIIEHGYQCHIFEEPK